MESLISISTEKLRSDHEAFEGMIKKMEAAIKEAGEAVEALNATWEGPGHDALIEELHGDQERMKTMLINLRNYREELEHAEKEYAACEGKVSGVVDSMRV